METIFRDTLSLGLLAWRPGDNRNITIQALYEDNVAVLLRHLENVGLISREGEIMNALSVEIIDRHAAQKALAPIISAIDGSPANSDGLRRLDSIAASIGVSESRTLDALYHAAIAGMVDLGSRVDRIIRYQSLRLDVTQADLEAIELEMSRRRQYKKQQLAVLVSYLKNKTICRARLISGYLGESMGDCNRCDVCTRSNDFCTSPD